MENEYPNTILIVDDNLGARRSIEALLSKENYRLILASSGLEAMEIAKQESPDLILLDVMMPGMNGFEVCQLLRADSRLSEVPIIMITALDDDESMIRGIDVGADDFLSKPINKIELRSRIRGILRLNRYRKLCEERQKFEHVVENSKFGYIVIDQNNDIRFTNPSARKILELPDDSDDIPNLFGRANALYTLKPSNAEELFNASPKSNSSEPFLLVRAQSKSAPSKWIRVNRVQISGSSGDQFLVRLEDITKNMLSFQEKHTFSRMISHKLLTPLNALKAADQISATIGIGGESFSQWENASDLRRKGIERLEYDIRSVLNFLESNDRSQNLKHLSALSDVVRTLNDTAKDIGLPFAIDSIPSSIDQLSIPISIYNFEACAREVYENAMKFTAEETPEVRCRILVEPTQDFVVVQFLTNATPLTEEEMLNAWKPYWQADRYFTGEIKGMGLGLSLIATNVWSSGGTCKIQNRDDNQGVKISLRFPIQ